MTESTVTESAFPRRRIFRKSLVIPTEHGAWSWLLVPFAVGTVVGSRVAATGSLPGLALLLTLIGGLSAYMIRQPATAWARIRRGRGRRADLPLVTGWGAAFATIALLCLLSLLALGRQELVGLLLPFAVILVLYLAAAMGGRAAMRALSMELAGAAGLALMAPAAIIAATGHLNALVWPLWVLMALQNVLGVLYVRNRLADTHGRPASKGLTLGGHLVALLVVLAGIIAGWFPWPVLLPFVGFLLRALWVVRRPRPVANVRRFGFTEVGMEILGGALIAVSYL